MTITRTSRDVGALRHVLLPFCLCHYFAIYVQRMHSCSAIVAQQLLQCNNCSEIIVVRLLQCNSCSVIIELQIMAPSLDLFVCIMAQSFDCLFDNHDDDDDDDNKDFRVDEADPDPP